MKNLTDLPEATRDQVTDKIRCYFAERRRIVAFAKLLESRCMEIDKIIEDLLEKEAQIIMKREGITPVKLSLK